MSGRVYANIVMMVGPWEVMLQQFFLLYTFLYCLSPLLLPQWAHTLLLQLRGIKQWTIFVLNKDILRLVLFCKINFCIAKLAGQSTIGEAESVWWRKYRLMKNKWTQKLGFCNSSRIYRMTAPLELGNPQFPACSVSANFWLSVVFLKYLWKRPRRIIKSVQHPFSYNLTKASRISTRASLHVHVPMIYPTLLTFTQDDTKSYWASKTWGTFLALRKKEKLLHVVFLLSKVVVSLHFIQEAQLKLRKWVARGLTTSCWPD